ncbi:MAG: hypothetical protein AAF146_10445 [Bacteroidota bacterium]
MKFSLQKLEQYLPDELLEKAEALLSNSPPPTLREIEKNLWTTTIMEASEPYEVEIQLRGNRLAAYSCDCKNYGPKSLCVHLTASLLQLRRQKQAAVEAKQQKRELAPPPPRRLTTNIILQSISNQELSDFVRNYAKSNRQFALALKARFASAIPGMDREEKYQQILLTAIKSVRRPGGHRIPQSGLRTLIKVLEELQEQCLDTITRRDFEEGFAILTAIFEATPAIFRHLDGDKKLLLDCLEGNIHLLDQLLRAEPAPELAERVWEFLRQAFGERFLALYRFDRQLLQLALEHSTDPARAQRLLDTVEAVRRLSEEQELLAVDLIVTQLDLLETLVDPAASEALLREHLRNVPVLEKAIELAEGQEDMDKVRQLIEVGLELEGLETEVRTQWEDRLLQLARERADWEAVRGLARQLFLRTYQSPYWEQLRTVGDANWPQQKEEVLAALAAQPFSVGQRDAQAHIYASEEDWTGLLRFLQQIRSIDLLLHTDRYLLPDHRSAIYDLYRDLLTEYLDQHLGRQPSQKVKKVLLHLRERGETDFVAQLLQSLRREYRLRHSLIEELAEL